VEREVVLSGYALYALRTWYVLSSFPEHGLEMCGEGDMRCVEQGDDEHEGIALRPKIALIRQVFVQRPLEPEYSHSDWEADRAGEVSPLRPPLMVICDLIFVRQALTSWSDLGVSPRRRLLSVPSRGRSGNRPSDSAIGWRDQVNRPEDGMG
jgi:hypothetical protein